MHQSVIEHTEIDCGFIVFSFISNSTDDLGES
jgi:hypothetical protein